MDAIRARKKRIFDIIQIGNRDDWPSRLFDIGLIVMILANLFIVIFDTFQAAAPYRAVLDRIELVTVLAFTGEYILRVWTAEFLYPALPRGQAAARYMTSFSGVIDLLSFFPYYLPIFFPAGVVAFRIFRVVRIFRLFQVNAYYDAMNVISDVLRSKRDQLVSSIFIILVLMTASSLIMYGLEHDAQPEVFKNAFSGFWWAVSTLLTVGYGDIYPVTVPGRVFGTILTFLGVGMVAIPTGILSAGFVEQYSRLKSSGGPGEAAVSYLQLPVEPGHPWQDRTVAELGLPPGLLLAAIQRQDRVVLPREDTVVRAGDRLVLGAESGAGRESVELREVTLTRRHPWAGALVRDLDVSRRTLLVTVRRGEQTLVPGGDTRLEPGDRVLLCTRKEAPPPRM